MFTQSHTVDSLSLSAPIMYLRWRGAAGWVSVLTNYKSEKLKTESNTCSPAYGPLDTLCGC